MKFSDLFRMFVLAAIWGGSYALLRVVAPVFGGWDTAWLRVSIAGLVLVVYATLLSSPLGWKHWWKQYLFVGLFNSVFPFALIGFGMKTLPAGYGAIINALSPFFGLVFAAILLAERVTATRILGLVLGFVGVAMLINLGPVPLTNDVLIALGACVMATMSYGFAGVWVKKHMHGAPSMGLAGGALVVAGTAMTPFSLALGHMPVEMPSNTVWFSLFTLAIVCTAIAYLLYFRLIADLGPTRAISVTFLIPFFGVAWGAVLFDEQLTRGAVFGALVILLGMALVLGVFPLRQKR